jgi:hypothetical protein
VLQKVYITSGDNWSIEVCVSATTAYKGGGVAPQSSGEHHCVIVCCEMEEGTTLKKNLQTASKEQKKNGSPAPHHGQGLILFSGRVFPEESRLLFLLQCGFARLLESSRKPFAIFDRATSPTALNLMITINSSSIPILSPLDYSCHV